MHTSWTFSSHFSISFLTFSFSFGKLTPAQPKKPVLPAPPVQVQTRSQWKLELQHIAAELFQSSALSKAIFLRLQGERERKRDFRKKCQSSCTFKRSLRERDREREQKYSSLMPFSSAHTTNKYQVVPGMRRDGSFEKGK